MDGRTDISIERIQMNLEVEHIVRQRRWLEIWPETPILPKLLFSWPRLPM